MSVRIEQFEWDEHNLGHLAHAHPEFELELLEEIWKKGIRGTTWTVNCLV